MKRCPLISFSIQKNTSHHARTVTSSGSIDREHAPCLGNPPVFFFTPRADPGDLEARDAWSAHPPMCGLDHGFTRLRGVRTSLAGCAHEPRGVCARASWGVRTSLAGCVHEPRGVRAHDFRVRAHDFRVRARASRGACTRRSGACTRLADARTRLAGYAHTAWGRAHEAWGRAHEARGCAHATCGVRAHGLRSRARALPVRRRHVISRIERGGGIQP
jgi:hypothetical protein